MPCLTLAPGHVEIGCTSLGNHSEKIWMQSMAWYKIQVQKVCNCKWIISAVPAICQIFGILTAYHQMEFETDLRCLIVTDSCSNTFLNLCLWCNSCNGTLKIRWLITTLTPSVKYVGWTCGVLVSVCGCTCSHTNSSLWALCWYGHSIY